MRKRRTFDPQFKREAVELSCSPNMTQRRVCEELGISQNLLSRWRREHLGDARSRPVSSEVALLRKELADARNELAARDEEIEFLKKAAGYFARTSERGMR